MIHHRAAMKFLTLEYSYPRGDTERDRVSGRKRRIPPILLSLSPSLFLMQLS